VSSLVPAELIPQVNAVRSSTNRGRHRPRHGHRRHTGRARRQRRPCGSTWPPSLSALPPCCTCATKDRRRITRNAPVSVRRPSRRTPSG